MNDHYEKCQKCGQWISPVINHYAKVEDERGKVFFLHHNPCLWQYAEEHPIIVLEEHVNQRR